MSNSEHSLVSLVACADYDLARVRQAVRQSLDHLGGIGEFVKPGQKVLLKPNVAWGMVPESAGNTHPAVLEALVELVREAGGEVSIGESGINYTINAVSFRLSGLAGLCERMGVPLHDFEASGGIERRLQNNPWVDRIYIARPVVEADVVITVPKMKTHMFTYITGAIKIIHGVLPGAQKQMMHRLTGNATNFCYLLADTWAQVRPALTLMDGIVGMAGLGPLHGQPVPSGLLLASRDPVALDVTMCRLMEIDPRKPPSNRIGAERGLGINDPDRIQVKGESVEKLKRHYPTTLAWFCSHYPGFLFKPGAGWVVRLADVTVDPEKCQHCGTCVKACSTQSLRLPEQGTPIRDRKRCAYCFRCFHICPNRAVVRAHFGMSKAAVATMKKYFPEFYAELNKGEWT